MTTTTTADPAILKGLLETNLFGGLGNITDEDIVWVKTKVEEERGSPDKERGQVIGHLNDLEIHFLAFSHKLDKQVEEMRQEGLAKLPELESSFGTEKMGEIIAEQLTMAGRFEKLQAKAKLIEEILNVLFNDRFAEKGEEIKACHLTIDANFDVRATVKGEDCEDCPLRYLLQGRFRRDD